MEKYFIDLELLTSLMELMHLNLPTLNPKWHKKQHRFGTPHFPCGVHALNLPTLNPKLHKKNIDLELLISLVRFIH
jgi:hypothetical protein